MIAGGAVVGAAGAASAATVGAVRAGTSMGSAASTAYSLGKETAAKPTVGAGLRGVATAAGNAAREHVSGSLGLREAAAGGRQAAWDALNRTSSATPPAGANDDRAPGWARAMRTQQTARHHRQLAVHSLQQGDRGGGGASPDIKERD